MGGLEERDLARLEVPRVGAVREGADSILPFQLVGPDGREIAEVDLYLRDLRARDASIGSIRSYALALLRWYRFLWAISADWERATRTEARDFMLWLASVRKPERRRVTAPPPGSVNTITRKPYSGAFYAARTRRHNRTVVRSFYEFHRLEGHGPLLNPMPERVGRGGERADAHHNPMEPFVVGRRADFQPKLARRALSKIPDRAFDELFVAMPSSRDRAILAFYISTGARASELLGVTADRVDVGQQMIGVHRKGSGALQWLPASPDAFVWLQFYRRDFADEPGFDEDRAVWKTLRRPFRPLTYAAMRAVFVRANASLGTNWTLHDLRHTAARRMVDDPNLSLADVQWVLGHARITTTQLYTEPAVDEVVEKLRDHYRRRALADRTPAAPAPGYRPEVLDTLLGPRR